jgi:hypothetical protein
MPKRVEKKDFVVDVLNCSQQQFCLIYALKGGKNIVDAKFLEK